MNNWDYPSVFVWTRNPRDNHLFTAIHHMSELGCKGEEGGEEEGREGEGDVGAGILNSRGVGSIDVWMTTSDADQTCSCTCEVCTSIFRGITFNSKVEIIH
jgi:hypothetical protein